MSRPPIWALELLRRVAWDEQIPSVLPKLRWRKSSTKVLSRGTWYIDHNEILVTAGKDRGDQKMTLLHEAAHWVADMQAGSRPQHHNEVFWDTAWRLYRRYGVPLRIAYKREKRYRKGAAAAYRRSP